jgi:hypothetical protein
MSKKDLYSARFSRSSRTFFFDIKESNSGSLYLQISESRHADEGFQFQRLTVFSENLDNFIDELAKAIFALKKISEQRYALKKLKSGKK